MKRLLVQIAALFRRPQLEHDLEEELQFHLQMETEKYITRGLPPDEARRIARMNLGGYELTQERVRRVAFGTWSETIRQEVLITLRSLAKKPLFTLTAVLCLGVGIGSNTALLAFFYGIVIRPLPYEQSSRLVDIDAVNITQGERHIYVNYPEFRFLREQMTTCTDLAAYDWASVTLTGRGDPEKFMISHVSSSLLTLLGVSPHRGRGFNVDDEQPGSTPAAIISHRIWQERFNGAFDVIGQTVQLNEIEHRVIGVMPEDFGFPGPAEMWLPLGRYASENRSDRWLRVVGRLAHGMQLEHVKTECATLSGRLRSLFPEANEGVEIAAVSLKESAIDEYQNTVTALYAAASLILLLACANIANLMLARGTSRRREIAIRRAVGAGKYRILGHLLTESFVVATVGCLIGIPVALLGRHLILTGAPAGTIPAHFTFEIDPGMMLIIAVITAAVGIFIGITPAIDAARYNVIPVLQGTRQGERGPGRRLLFRQLLIAIEVGLTVVLLIGAAVLLKGLAEFRSIEPGFDPENLLVMEVNPQGLQYRTDRGRIEFIDRIVQEAREIPGVENATAVSYPPVGGAGWPRGFLLEDLEIDIRNTAPVAGIVFTASSYFETMRIPLKAGRPFNDSDSAISQPVAVINQYFADRYWAGENPVGKRIRIELREPLFSSGQWVEIVGVVGNTFRSGIHSPLRERIYLPQRQAALSGMNLVVRYDLDSEGIMNAVREAVWRVEPSVSLTSTWTMQQLIDEENWESPLYSSLFLILSLIALVLAVTGVYGAVAYSMEQRVPEFGIRLALGARPRSVLVEVLRRILFVAGAGLGIGLVLAFMLLRVIASRLYGINPVDIPIYLTCFVTLLMVTALAAYFPVRQILNSDPVEVLRYE